MRIALICLAFIVYGCNVTNGDIARYQEKFQEKKGEFEQLFLAIANLKPQAGYGINTNDLPENIQQQLKDLDLVNLRISDTKCPGIYNYKFRTRWTKKATVYFYKTFCDKESAQNGYHQKVSEMIELWGLGEGWIMMIDYDFI